MLELMNHTQYFNFVSVWNMSRPIINYGTMSDDIENKMYDR